jgi:hypothetical protein
MQALASPDLAIEGQTYGFTLDTKPEQSPCKAINKEQIHT